MSLQVSSKAFGDGDQIARKYTEDGQNVSPPLQIGGVPDDAKALALIVDDPDAPRDEPFVHWVMYNIPPDVYVAYKQLKQWSIQGRYRMRQFTPAMVQQTILDEYLPRVTRFVSL